MIASATTPPASASAAPDPAAAIVAAARRCRPRRTIAALLSADALALVLAMLLAMAVRTPFPGVLHVGLYPALLLVLPVFLAAYFAAGLYPGIASRAGLAVAPVEELRRSARATTVMFLALGATAFASREPSAIGYSRAVFVLAWLFSLLLVPLARGLLRAACAHRPWWGTPCVVLGAGAAGETVLAALQRHPGLGLKPVAVLDDAPAPPTTLRGVPVPGGLDWAPRLVQAAGINYGIVALPGVARDRLLAVLRGPGAAFPHLLVIPDLFGMASLWVEAKDLGGVLGLELREQLLLPGPRRVKRLLDVALALAASVLVLPLLGLLALLVRLDSRGPAVFRQERLGRDGRPFAAWKFRTMHLDAEARLQAVLAQHPDWQREYATYHKLRHDPRVTRLGRLLRKFSLDELPQLWNVLRGDMSLVGPRAYIPGERPAMGEAAAVILRVPPGITGLWQVSGRNAIPFTGRLQLDIYYVRNWSLWLDLYLLARTPWCIIRREGAY